MPRGNGGVLGPANIPTTSVAKGVWSLMEQQLAQRQGIWPAGPLVFDPYFEYTTLLLPGNGTNGAQNNTFLDGSTNNFTITRNGNTTQGTFSPFSQTGWGNYFDGSGDYLTTPNNAALTLGSGDFTIEMFIFCPNTANGNIQILYDQRSAGGQTVPTIYLESNGYLQYYVAGANKITYSTAVTSNAWNHIAISRSGSNTIMFLNGAQVGSTYTTLDTLAGNAVGIGAYLGTPSLYYTGYMSNLRVVKGTAVYTSNFTPPTSPLTAITNTSLLTCQSNRFIDNSSNNFTITRNGDTRVVAFSPFNPTASWSAAAYGGSGYFDGNGDYLTIPDDASWDLSSSTGSMELFVYQPVAATGTPGLIGQCPTTANWSIYIYSDGRIAIGIQGLSELATAGGSLIVNSMNHIVITRDSGTSRTRLFVNGILKATGTGTYFNNSSASLHIGYFNGYSFNGYISEVRFCKGSIPTTYQTSSITVGDSIFTPPSAPITTSSQGATSGDVKLLLNFTNAGIYDATSKNDLETVGNAQISTTQSKWGGSSISFDGTGDWLLIPDQPPQRIGTGNFTIEMWVYRNSSGTYGLAGKGTGTTGWLVSLNSSNQVVFTYGSSTITSSGTVSATTWTHIAVVREGTSTNQTKIYIGGSNDGTGTVSTDFNQTNSMYIGADRTGGSAANAYVQDVRITNYARYTANFTPPTTAFPTL